MSEIKDFIALKGVLKNYKGSDTDVVIPKEIDGYPITKIDSEAFFEGWSSDNDIKNIVIPETVKVIAKNAFFCVKKLQSIILPESLEEIGATAFEYCENLREVIIPKTVKKIGSGVFHDCENLEKVVFEGELDKIPSKTFAGCAKLKEIVLPKGLEIIGDSAFRGCNELEELHIPEGVVKIGSRCFAGCLKLKEIIIPSSVTVIEKGLFAEEIYSGTASSSIEKVVLSEGVQIIDKRAFESCNSLKEISLPKSLKQIREEAFSWCDNLEQINLSNGLESISPLAFNCCKKLQEIKIPGSVKAVDNGSFSECIGLKKVTIEEGCERIGYKAFDKCESIEEIYLPNSIERIDSYAFTSSPKAKVFTKEGSYADLRLKEGSDIWGTMLLDDGTVKICDYREDIESVIMPEEIDGFKVSEISDGTFCGDRKMRSITFSSGIKTIGNWLLRNIDALRVVRFSDAMTSTSLLSTDVLGSQIEVLILPSINPKDISTYWKKAATVGYLKASYQGDFPQGEIATEWENYLAKTVRKNPKNLYDLALKHEKVLLAMLSRKLVPLKDIEELLIKVQDNVSIKALLINYQNNNFTQQDIEKAEEKKIEKALNTPKFTTEELKKLWGTEKKKDGTLKTKEFYGWHNKLEAIIVPEKIGKSFVTTIGNGTFEDEDDIREVIIPEGVLEIQTGAFRQCKNLKKVQIPKSLLKIKDYAFVECPLIELEFVGENNLIKKKAKIELQAKEGPSLWEIDDCENDKSVAIVAYKGIEKDIKIPNEVNGKKVIKIVSFDLENLRKEDVVSIVIPKTIKEIDSGTFKDFVNLRKVVLPEGLKELSSGLFYGCKELACVNIPESLAEIGSSSFYGCSKLSIDYIPSKVNLIGENAFRETLSYNNEKNWVDGVFYIGDWLISIKESLLSVNIRKGTRYFAQNPFGNIEILEKVNYDGQIAEFIEIKHSGLSPFLGLKIENLCFDNKVISDLIIDFDIDELNSCIFKNCKSIKTVLICGSIKAVNIQTFNGCENLEEIIIDESVEIVNMHYFRGCFRLKSLRLSNKIKKIEDTSFSSGCEDCKALVIYSPKGSVAEKYAKEKKVAFSAI